jgi:hypothetical protein
MSPRCCGVPMGVISKLDLLGLARHFGVSVQAVFVDLARLRLVSWGLARRAGEDPGIRDEILRVGARCYCSRGG